LVPLELQLNLLLGICRSQEAEQYPRCSVVMTYEIIGSRSFEVRPHQQMTKSQVSPNDMVDTLIEVKTSVVPGNVDVLEVVN
jgi:hypothetical protein